MSSQIEEMNEVGTPFVSEPIQMAEKQSEYRRWIAFWRVGFALLLLLSMGLLVAVVVLAVRSNGAIPTVSLCDGTDAVIDVTEPADPEPHNDLTTEELKRLRDYLYKVPELNLVPTDDIAAFNRSHIYVTDLFLPKKADALAYYNNKKKDKPSREARVIIFRGDKTPPLVEEYIVTLSGPSISHRLLKSSARRNPVEYIYRPWGAAEFLTIEKYITAEIDRLAGRLLQESYGATLTNCETKCLTFYPVMSTAAVEQAAGRLVWLRLMHFVEYYTLHPLDFAVLVDSSSMDAKSVVFKKAYYNGKMFDSLPGLMAAYDSGAVNKSTQPFPSEENLFSTMRRRGDPIPRKPLRAPYLVEPDGKRYDIRHRRIEYMQWQIDFRLSTLNGPQFYNILFNGERIAYELGLQEIGVFYSGHEGFARFADFVDSAVLLGPHARTLIPGADCPVTATYVSSSFLGEASEPIVSQRAMCIFELNTGTPLRRHLSYHPDQGSFYAGMEDSALVVRTLLTIANYDYIFDFIFHQNGAIEVKTRSTGYILSSFYNTENEPYGWNLQKNVLGNIHHHVFHFKADLDIGGTINRYETLDIVPEKVSNAGWSNPSTNYWQIRMNRTLKATEMEAVYDFNFNTPKYHIVYSGSDKRPKAYRIKMDGISKQLLPEGSGNEQSISWARHQLVATKFKDDESTSSTPYGMFDAFKPVVNFTSYYADNESIENQDIVFWLALGIHHIPHTEDLPVTPTPGFSLDFSLQPYNYFKECPSMASRDAIRVELKNAAQPSDGVRVVREGHAAQAQCVTNDGNLEEELEQNPDLGLMSKQETGAYL